MLVPKLVEKIENIFNKKIVKVKALSGGCISPAYYIRLENGQKHFIKIGPQYENMFLLEKKGLSEMSKISAIRVPKVYYADEELLILEFIVQGNPKVESASNFGRKIANLHKHTSDLYGFYQDNYLGATIQKNLPMVKKTEMKWFEFFYRYRLSFQMEVSRDKGILTTELEDALCKLKTVMGEVILEDDEMPSFLHGDLWSGNYFFDQEGEACIYDPAPYYGNREAEFGMITLFGGFDSSFFEGYQKEYPLNDGWRGRNKIYQLYHLLNHFNLFGSGYYKSCLDVIYSYI